MKRILLFAIIALLAVSCQQKRYGHLTFRVHKHKSTYVTTHREKVEKVTDKSLIQPHSISEVGFVEGMHTTENVQPAATYLDAKIPDWRNMEVVTKATEEREELPPKRALHFIPIKKKIKELRMPEQASGLTVWQFLGMLIVVALFLAAIAWLGTLIGLNFWTVYWIAAGVFLLALVFGKSDLG